MCVCVSISKSTLSMYALMTVHHAIVLAPHRCVPLFFSPPHHCTPPTLQRNTIVFLPLCTTTPLHTSHFTTTPLHTSHSAPPHNCKPRICITRPLHTSHLHHHTIAHLALAPPHHCTPSTLHHHTIAHLPLCTTTP